MKLLINNSTDKPITLFIEPWCEERKFPPGAEAIVYFGDMDLHTIDIHENQLSIYDEGTKDFSIEVILKEEKVFAESLRLAYTWLHKLGGKDAAVAMEESAEVRVCIKSTESVCSVGFPWGSWCHSLAGWLILP